MGPVDVVIIDDNEGVRWILEEVLSLGNISHDSAATGREGLRLIEEYQPALTIVDLKLGAMTGLAVAHKARTFSPETRILFLTGYPEVLRKKNLSDIPVVAIMEKPFDAVELLSIVKENVSAATQT